MSDMIYSDKDTFNVAVLENTTPDLLSNDLLTYYQIFPKEITSSSITFYASAYCAPEIQIELECILGVMVDFCVFEESRIQQLIHRKKINDGLRSMS